MTAGEPVEGYEHYPRNEYKTLERKLHIYPRDMANISEMMPAGRFYHQAKLDRNKT